MSYECSVSVNNCQCQDLLKLKPFFKTSVKFKYYRNLSYNWYRPLKFNIIKLSYNHAWEFFYFYYADYLLAFFYKSSGSSSMSYFLTKFIGFGLNFSSTYFWCFWSSYSSSSIFSPLAYLSALSSSSCVIYLCSYLSSLLCLIFLFLPFSSLGILCYLFYYSKRNYQSRISTM